MAGSAVLSVGQNLHLALCDYACVIAEGCPSVEGPCAEVAANPEIRQAYLGLLARRAQRFITRFPALNFAECRFMKIARA
jgi:hypothetical protein